MATVFSIRFRYHDFNAYDMHHDNQVVIFIHRNLIFHERTKDVEINNDFIHKKVLIEDI